MPDQIDLENEDDFDIGESDTAEQQEKEKTMSIRDKLSKRKQGGTPAAKTASSSGKSRKGFMTPLLLLLLVIVGGLIFWQLKQLSDSIALAMLGSGTFDSSSSPEPNSSYDYAIDFILDPNLTDRMAARGRDGWQVVGSRRTQDSTTGQYGYEFIFMRRIPGR